MRSLVCLLTLATVLAGCLGTGTPGADRGGPPTLTGPEATLSFSQPVLVGPQGDAETSLLVHGDTVLTCSHGGFYQPSPLWASVGGEPFERIDPQPNPIPSGDCDLAVLDSGRWVIVYDTIASATIAWSDDQGASWGFQYAAALPIAVDRPWIAAAGGETLYMTYSDVMAAEPALQMFARSDDGGETWTGHTPLNVAEPPDDVQAVIGKMVLSDNGQTIHVPLARSNILLGGALSMDLAVSRDAGRTWSLEPVYGPYDAGGLVLPVATWAGDVLHVAVVLPNGTAHDIGVLRLTDAGWTPPVLVAHGVRLPGVKGPWMDGRDDGSVTLAWLEEVDAGWTTSVARLSPEDTVLGPVQLAPPTGRAQSVQEFIMLDHGSDGRAHVTWPMDTGPECDPEPNQLERRGSQCVYMAVETL